MNAHDAREHWRVDAAQWDDEHGGSDPAAAEHVDAAQERYERALGWGVD